MAKVFKIKSIIIIIAVLTLFYIFNYVGIVHKLLDSVKPRDFSEDLQNLLASVGNVDYSENIDSFGEDSLITQSYVRIRNLLSSDNLKTIRQEAVKAEKDAIVKTLANYKLCKDDRCKTTRKFEYSKYALESGGKPLRNIILTSWRSGSAFLDDALSILPGTFYHYEPLSYLGITQMRSEELAGEGLATMNNLLNCNYTNLDNYIKFASEQQFIHDKNRPLRPFLQTFPQLRSDAGFISDVCKTFPFQLVKSARLRLKPAETLLENADFDVRILLLIRDPRGTINSIMNLNPLCTNAEDCYNSKMLCSDLVSDFYAAEELREKYPNRILIIRYEDLELNPYSGMKKILQFFRHQYHSSVKRFVELYKEKSKSKSTPFQWQSKFRGMVQELANVQSNCEEAMDLWGYDAFDPFVHKNDFNPMMAPPWDEMTIKSGKS